MTKTMFHYEDRIYDLGYNNIAGVDEVGRGPLAGPLVVCAVILPKDYYLKGLNDSKQVSEKKRVDLYERIMFDALSVKTTFIYPDEIDKINIYQATKKGMYEVLDNLDVKPDYILIDAMDLNMLETPYESIIKGDEKSKSIAAASIVAKVTRDRYMENISNNFPYYDFNHNKGYGTKKHLEALEKYGPCEIHRTSYAPVRNSLIKQYSINFK